MNHQTPDGRSPEGVPSHHDAVHTEPHHGHGGTSFEGTDASVKLIISSLVIIAATLFITLAITVPIQRTLRDTTPLGQLPSPLAPSRVVPPKPQLQVHPWEELPELRAQWDQVLSSGGKDADGRVHVPINQAMDSVVSRLTIAPNAAVGITTPGGQGRDFSRGLDAMPPQYKRPQIQGEIRKNAQ